MPKQPEHDEGRPGEKAANAEKASTLIVAERASHICRSCPDDHVCRCIPCPWPRSPLGVRCAWCQSPAGLACCIRLPGGAQTVNYVHAARRVAA